MTIAIITIVQYAAAKYEHMKALSFHLPFFECIICQKIITFYFNTICQTQALNRGTLSSLQVHWFLISLWDYFTAFAYLLFPYWRQTKGGGCRDSGVEGGHSLCSVYNLLPLLLQESLNQTASKCGWTAGEAQTVKSCHKLKLRKKNRSEII